MRGERRAKLETDDLIRQTHKDLQTFICVCMGMCAILAGGIFGLILCMMGRFN